MNYDLAIIGGGIVGLAACLKVLKRKPGTRIVLLEKESEVALHQTGNNSGVIHSGIYYKPGSLKAKNCRMGYNQLLEYCNEKNINYEICGKVIVAVNDDQISGLNSLFERGIANGLHNLRILSASELKEFEPHVKGKKAIHVPETGIIDFKQVSIAFKNDIISRGAEIKLNTEVLGISKRDDFITIHTNYQDLTAKNLISCSGLQSDRIAKKTVPELPLRIIPFRGEYYKLKEHKRRLVNNLIYPVPDPAFPFLGVHFTRMINGEVEAGPNAVLSFKREGYNKLSFNLTDSFEIFTWPGFLKVAKKYWRTGLGEFKRSYSKKAFVNALQQLIPEITKEDIEAGGAGVRAQACNKDGILLDDFYIAENKNIFHVCNAPSPAATSSLSIGEYLADKYLLSLS